MHPSTDTLMWFTGYANFNGYANKHCTIVEIKLGAYSIQKEIKVPQYCLKRKDHNKFSELLKIWTC